MIDKSACLVWLWLVLIALAMVAIIFITAVQAEGKLAAPAAKEKPGNPEFYQKDKYLARKLDDGASVIMAGGQTVSILSKFSYYERDGRKKLKLVSCLGFVFENIPADETYFFNESVATFLEGEKLLPLAKKWLTDNNYAGRDLAGLIFSFPDNPLIDAKNGYTYFSYQAWVESGHWSGSRRRRYWIDTSRWEASRVVGLTDYAGAGHAIVTYGYQDSRSIIVHEYIHMCGYGSKYHDRHIFAEGGIRATYKKHK